MTSQGDDNRQYTYAGNDVVLDYSYGRLSLEGFLDVCRSYRGPEPHFLWATTGSNGNGNGNGDDDDEWGVFELLLAAAPEDKLYALLQSIVKERPDVLTATSSSADGDGGGGGGCLLHSALAGQRKNRAVHRLLAVPGTTRIVDGSDRSSLHVACKVGMEFPEPFLDIVRSEPGDLLSDDPDIIHWLMDLDADVLTHADSMNRVPLHYALTNNPTSPCVERMIRLRPGTLLHRDENGLTPIGRALKRSGHFLSTNGYSLLRQLVDRHPQSVALVGTELGRSDTPLFRACGGDFDDDDDDYEDEDHDDYDDDYDDELCQHATELVRSVLKAYPPALVVPNHFRPIFALWEDWTVLLPFERVAQRRRGGDGSGGGGGGNGRTVAELVWTETLHMTLAVIEYVLDLDTAVLLVARDDEGGSADTAANVSWFQEHIRSTVQEHAPQVLSVDDDDGYDPPSGLSVAKAVHQWMCDNKDNNPAVVAFLRALFVHDKALELLRGEGRLLRNIVLCETVTDLYQMNRLGRHRVTNVVVENTRRENSTPPAVSALAREQRHQLELLDSIKDSGTVESTYLQFRQVSHQLLLLPSSQQRQGRRFVVAAAGAATTTTLPVAEEGSTRTTTSNDRKRTASHEAGPEGADDDDSTKKCRCGPTGTARGQ